MNKSSVSIILCFYNAEKKLSETIKYLMKLNIDGIEGIELIFVDNNSNDSSCELIKKMLQGFSKFPYKIILEPKPGLSNARLIGIANAKYDYLLFCDDDNWLEEDYILRGLKILNNNSTIAALGGYGVAVSDIHLPYWFNEYEKFYAVGPQMPQNGKVYGVRNVVYGAGVFIRKSAFEYIQNKGFSFYNLGRTGKKLSSGEDSEMCLAFQIAGFSIWYDDSLKFKHYIEPNRLSKKYIKKLQKGMNESSYISRFYRHYLFGYQPNITKYFWVKEFLYSLKDGMFAIITAKWKRAIRSFRLCNYLLNEQKRYNDNVLKIYNICKMLDSSNQLKN